ncbi:MAG: LysR family transcriptional regulator, partial [Clostridia bacterium]|nr:LysR family transcriptional regulator [Clostridia bacterium]
MNILKYRALLCVLEQGSFSKAAEKLDYTQSGLTHMMNSLEEEVWLPLIERGYFGVRPTEAGEALLPLIREMLEKADALQAQIDKRLFTVRRIVRIGAFSSIALHWLPEVLERFKRECPDYIAEVRLGGVDDLYRSLQTGENDLIFASAVKDAPCRFIPLCEDKMYALLPPGEPPPPG